MWQACMPLHTVPFGVEKPLATCCAAWQTAPVGYPLLHALHGPGLRLLLHVCRVVHLLGAAVPVIHAVTRD